MTDIDIPSLIERLHSKATDCPVSEEPLYLEAAEALSGRDIACAAGCQFERIAEENARAGEVKF